MGGTVQPPKKPAMLGRTAWVLSIIFALRTLLRYALLGLTALAILIWTDSITSISWGHLFHLSLDIFMWTWIVLFVLYLIVELASRVRRG
jgi:hypothetical protein